MKIPNKIDDRLKDAIVSFQFASEIPQEAILGYFHNIFRRELTYISFTEPTNNSVLIEKQVFYFLDSEKKFRIDCSENTLTFNLVNEYKGWHNYLKLIRSVLEKMFDNGMISKITRIGIRYISLFEDISIFDKIKGVFELNIPQIEHLRSQFRTEFQTDDFLAVITLVNKYPKEANSFFSIIDIDVIKAIPKEENSMETLIATLEQAHSKEKNIFFSLLKKEFLDTLNPQYK